MQTAISLPILQISNMLSQHYKSLQERPYLSCLSENSNNEKLCFMKHQEQQLHLIPVQHLQYRCTTLTILQLYQTCLSTPNSAR
jgi:hypothetical protein